MWGVDFGFGGRFIFCGLGGLGVWVRRREGCGLGKGGGLSDTESIDDDEEKKRGGQLILM